MEERYDTLQQFFGLELSESLAKSLSTKQVNKLVSQLKAYGNRCAESFAREILKTEKGKRLPLIERVAAQNS